MEKRSTLTLKVNNWNGIINEKHNYLYITATVPKSHQYSMWGSCGITISNRQHVPQFSRNIYPQEWVIYELKRYLNLLNKNLEILRINLRIHQ